MTYHVPTTAERQTSLSRCCLAGCHAPRSLRVVVVARPPTVAGDYAEYHTPHAVCTEHAESSWLTVDLVTRASEQKIIRAAAEVEHGWPQSAVLLSVSTRSMA